MIAAVARAPQPDSLAGQRGAKRRIRVLHVALNLQAGGLERLVVQLANRVDPTRYDSHVLVLQYAGRHSSELRDPDALHVGRPLSRWSMVWPGALADTLRRISPDIVHTHSGVWYKTSLAARIAGVRCSVHTDHGRLMPDPWSDRLSDGIAARRTNLVVAVSEPLAAYMRKALRVPAAKLRVVRNGVETAAFASQGRGTAVRAELGLAPDTPVIGSIGRLDAIKGYDVLLESFRLLRAGWPTVPAPALVIAGDGPDEPHLHAMLAAMDESVRRDVHLLGWRTDPNEVLGALDLFAMSSRSEGTSVSLLEAMSAGLCPVVTDVGGNADVLGKDLQHRLVPGDNAPAFAQALAEALWDRAARMRDGVRSRARVDAQFSIGAMVRRYEQIYSGLPMT